MIYKLTSTDMSKVGCGDWCWACGRCLVTRALCRHAVACQSLIRMLELVEKNAGQRASLLRAVFLAGLALFWVAESCVCVLAVLSCVCVLSLLKAWPIADSPFEGAVNGEQPVPRAGRSVRLQPIRTPQALAQLLQTACDSVTGSVGTPRCRTADRLKTSPHASQPLCSAVKSNSAGQPPTKDVMDVRENCPQAAVAASVLIAITYWVWRQCSVSLAEVSYGMNMPSVCPASSDSMWKPQWNYGGTRTAVPRSQGDPCKGTCRTPDFGLLLPPVRPLRSRAREHQSRHTSFLSLHTQDPSLIAFPIRKTLRGARRLLWDGLQFCQLREWQALLWVGLVFSGWVWLGVCFYVRRLPVFLALPTIPPLRLPRMDGWMDMGEMRNCGCLSPKRARARADRDCPPSGILRRLIDSSQGGPDHTFVENLVAPPNKGRLLFPSPVGIEERARFWRNVMVSRAEVSDPSHAGTLLSHLNEQRLDGGLFCDVTVIAGDDAKFRAHQSVLAACSPYLRELLSSPLPLGPAAVAAAPGATQLSERVVELPHLKSDILSDLLDYIYTSRVSLHGSRGAKQLSEAGKSLGIPFLASLAGDPGRAKNKADSSASSPSLDFPCSLPRLPRNRERHTPPSLPSGVNLEDSQWKMAAVDKQRHFDSERSPSPIDLTAPARKDPKSSSVVQFQSLPHELPPQSTLPLPAYPMDAGPTETGGGGVASSTDDAAPVKQRSESKDSVSGSLSPPPVSKGFFCGLCHRSFSLSSSLSVHMRLHRGGRTLSCRHCGKAFIHNKRLQSHEALCGQPRQQEQTALVAPAKEEDQGNCEDEEKEEEEEVGERREKEEEQEPQGRSAPARIHKKGRGFLGRHRSFQRTDLLAEEDHFVKVVDGHIIYFCTVCERSYMTLSSLKRHSNVHSWRRKYPCRYCDKVFALAEYRTKHEVWHTGERRYQCIFCWETFVTYYNLKTHQKSFHGINPGLITSEKTPNGGYKQKVNALKLYRLLPMRSQKRPYKTYSQSLSENILLSSDNIPSVPLALPMDGGLPAPLGSDQLQSYINEKHTMGLQADPAGYLLAPPLDPETSASTVIAYGHPKPSVIVHGTSVEYIQSQKRASKSENSTAEEEGRQPSSADEEKRPQKTCKAHGKSVTYVAKPACVGGSSETKGGAPLCQITVRIGEEAIVKRSISETDLMRDKSPPPSKTKKADSPIEEPIHHHQQHHHHHRHRSKDNNEKMPKPCKAREYYFRREVREEESDQDAEDNLWRPYYSYKPKRKAIHVQKVKKSSWQRKLHYKRSLRLTKRAERLVQQSAQDEGHERQPDASSALEDEQGEPEEQEELWCQICNQSFQDYLSMKRHERHHQVGKAFECSTCGRHFSTLKKLDKHELTHLMEFVCLLCQETFVSRSLLEEHQGTHHTKTENTLPQAEVGSELSELEKSNLPRVGRRPSVRHSCPFCSKVCKTAAALGRHMKRHGSDASDVAETATPRVSEATASDLEVDSEAKQDTDDSLKLGVGTDTALPTQTTELSCVTSPHCSKTVQPDQSLKSKRSDAPSGCAQSVLVLNGKDSPELHKLDTADSYKTERSPEAQTNAADHTTSTEDYKSKYAYQSTLIREASSGTDQDECSQDLRMLQTGVTTPPKLAMTSHSGGNTPEPRDTPKCPEQKGSTTQGLVMLPKGKGDSHPAAEQRVAALPREATPVQELTASSMEREAADSMIVSHGGKEGAEAKGIVKISKKEEIPASVAVAVSPEFPVIQTTAKASSNAVPSREQTAPLVTSGNSAQRRLKSPTNPPVQDLLRPRLGPSPATQAMVHEGQGLIMSRLTGVSAPQSVLVSHKSEEEPPVPRDFHREVAYPVQEFPLPLIVPGGCRSSKKQEDNILVSYPASAIQFGPLGKISNGDLGKLPFYPDPYQLLYGPQLLAYPYNLAALPMALNMMAPGDKGEPLPFLPTLFNYVNPCPGTVPQHHLVASSSQCSSSSSNSSNREGANQ
ncbi:ZBT38 protein, partial [Atractosteus spatula]|nr:ZBT38 protein [Atractosteus spatula]